MRPNLVLVVIDTLRADKLGAYGFPGETSPAFDALAERGILFERVLAPSSWTRPSMASLVTGLHPRSLGLFHEYHDVLGEQFSTLAEVLWAGGYRTLGATANPNLNRSFRFAQGFDEYIDSEVLFPWMEAHPGERSSARNALPPGRDLYRELVERIARSEQRPFYVQVNVMEVHEHLRMRRRPELYADAPERARYETLFDGHAEAAYLRTVRQATDEVAAFIEAVSALPGGRDTLFVVTSDHGEGLSDHPGVAGAEGHGFVLYESQLRVPLLFHHPEGALGPARRVARPVRLLDVMPTLLEVAGLPGPSGLHGVSLGPLLRGEDVELPDVFFAETRFQRSDKRAAYTADWKYYENREPKGPLPDRTLHPTGVAEAGARTNVAAHNPELAEQLAARLRAWERETPEAPPTRRKAPPSRREHELLRDLGYVE